MLSKIDIFDKSQSKVEKIVIGNVIGQKGKIDGKLYVITDAYQKTYPGGEVVTVVTTHPE